MVRQVTGASEQSDGGRATVTAIAAAATLAIGGLVIYLVQSRGLSSSASGFSAAPKGAMRKQVRERRSRFFSPSDGNASADAKAKARAKANAKAAKAAKATKAAKARARASYREKYRDNREVVGDAEHMHALPVPDAPSGAAYDCEYDDAVFEEYGRRVNTYDDPSDRHSVESRTVESHSVEEDTTDASKYEVVETAADGDCLFHCFEMALRPELTTTVRALREEVARRATQDQLEILKVIYNDARKENDWDQLQDYMFMQGVDTLDELRNAIRTKRYWGDEMALTALQDFTGLVPVVIKEDGRGNFEVARRIAPQGGSTRPPADALFVMLLLSHAHYRLVEYEGRAKMTIDMLPAPVRRRLFE